MDPPVPFSPNSWPDFHDQMTKYARNELRSRGLLGHILEDEYDLYNEACSRALAAGRLQFDNVKMAVGYYKKVIISACIDFGTKQASEKHKREVWASRVEDPCRRQQELNYQFLAYFGVSFNEFPTNVAALPDGKAKEVLIAVLREWERVKTDMLTPEGVKNCDMRTHAAIAAVIGKTPGELTQKALDDARRALCAFILERKANAKVRFQERTLT